MRKQINFLIRIYILLLLLIISSKTFSQSEWNYTVYKTINFSGTITPKYKLEYGTKSTGYDGRVKWRFTNYSNKTIYKVGINSKLYTLSDGRTVKRSEEYIASIIYTKASEMTESDAVNTDENYGNWSNKNDNPVKHIQVEEPMIKLAFEKNGKRYGWNENEISENEIKKENKVVEKVEDKPTEEKNENEPVSKSNYNSSSTNQRAATYEAQNEQQSYVQTYTKEEGLALIESLEQQLEINLSKAEEASYIIENTFNTMVNSYMAEQKYNERVSGIAKINPSIEDPKQLIDIYNRKLNEIEDLQRETLARKKAEIDAAIRSANQQAQTQVEKSTGELVGTFAKMSAAKNLAEEMNELEEELEEELKEQMTSVKDDIVYDHEKEKSNYMYTSAKCLAKEDEEYYLAMSKYHDCCINEIESNFYYKSTSWIEPYCSKPYRKNVSYSNLPKSKQYLNAAKRKYKLYNTTYNIAFFNAAKNFTNTSLAYDNKYADAYYFKAKLESNSVMKLVNLLTANSLKPGIAKELELTQAKSNFQNDFFNAIENDDTEFTYLAINKNLHNGLKKSNNETPYIVCIKNDRGEILNAILESESDKEKLIANNGISFLVLAIKNDAINCLNVLQQNGVDLIYLDNERKNPGTLYLAANHKSEKVAKKLISLSNNNLKYNLELSNKNNSNQVKDVLSFFITKYSLENDQVDNVNLALQYSPKAYDNKYDNSISLLDYAVKYNKNKCLKAFIEKGASINPQYIFVSISNNDYQNVELLLASGANVNTLNSGNTPLHVALIDDKIQCANIILNHSPDCNILNTKQMSPLLIAVWKGNYKLTKEIIELGADVNLQGVNGWTALHFAARENNIEIVKLLLDNKAKKGIKDNNKNTPYKIAKKSYFNDLARLLD